MRFCHWLGSDLTVSQLLVLKELVQGKFGKGEVLGIQWGFYANKRFASLERLNRGDLWKEHWPLADQLPLMGQEECFSHMDAPPSRGHMVGLLCQACASLEFHTLLASFTLMLEPTPVLALAAQSHAHKLGWAHWHVRRYGKHGLCLRKLLGIASSLPSVQ